MIPDATHFIRLPGYDHLEIEDQPTAGINGITAEQRLWHHFHLERVRRCIWRTMLSDHPGAQFSIKHDIEKYQALPKDR